MHHLSFSSDRPWLAPLAGFSDLPFRELCREHGCSVAVTEMVSAKGLIYGSPGTQELLQTSDRDRPLIVQIFGSEESFLLQSLERLREQGFRYFDLNCGCPVRKVAKTGSGAAILKTPEHLVKLARTLTAAVEPGCMGFKIRLGWYMQHPVYLDLSRELEQCGAGWITLHPRYGAQGFTGQADWTHLRILKEALRIPVVASGDLFSAEDGVRCIRETGVDTVMFARGALNDPGIFARYIQILRTGRAEEKKNADMIALIRRLCELYTIHGMDRQGLLKMRTLAPRFLKGLPGAKSIRRDMVTCRTWDDMFALLDTHCNEQKMEN